MCISISMLFVFTLLNGFTLFGQSVVIKNINSINLEGLIKEGKVQLIDVRTDREFASGHIEGAKQINISSGDFMVEMEKLDASKPVVLYCAFGGRSTAAVRKIKHLEFPVIYNFVGGIKEWKSKGLPLQKT